MKYLKYSLNQKQAALMYNIANTLIMIGGIFSFYFCQGITNLYIILFFIINYYQTILFFFILGKKDSFESWRDYFCYLGTFGILNICLININLSFINDKGYFNLLFSIIYIYIIFLSKNWVIKNEFARMLALTISNLIQNVFGLFKFSVIFTYIISLLWFTYIGVFIFDKIIKKLKKRLIYKKYVIALIKAVNFLFKIIFFRTERKFFFLFIYFFILVLTPLCFFFFQIRNIYIIVHSCNLCIIKFDTFLFGIIR